MQLLVELLLEKNGIPFDRREFEFQIKSHPAYPSLYSITAVLDHFKIEHAAARLPEVKDSLDQLPQYFIAQFRNNHAEALCFVEKSNDQYLLRGVNGQINKISEDDFLAVFTGVILIVEKTEEASVKNNTQNLFFKAGLGMLTIGFAFLLLLSISDIATPLMLFTSIVGVVLSVSIFQQEFGIKNAIGEALCSTDSKNSDCHAVLNSKGAIIIGKYKLSDLSLIYFLGLSLSVFLMAIQGLYPMPFFVITLLGLPITFYSIYYQALRVKRWCFLCLGIVGILWIQAGWVLFFELPNLSKLPQTEAVLSLVIGLLTSFCCWTYLKPKYFEIEEGKLLKVDYYKFKRNYEVFAALFNAKTPIDTVIEDTAEITLGNAESKLEIVIVTNPFCGHCKEVHSLVQDVLERYSELVKIVIRFNINVTDPHSQVVTIAANLTHIHFTRAEALGLQAMQDAFQMSSRKLWIEQWGGAEGISRQYIDDLKRQKTWCEANKINFTPAIIINGRPFPAPYARHDLIFFIEDLYEASLMDSVVQEELII